MENSVYTEAVEIFAGSQWEVELLKTLFENANIEAFLKDDIIGTTFPWHASGGGANPIKIIISSKDYDRALIILEEFKKNRDFK